MTILITVKEIKNKIIKSSKFIVILVYLQNTANDDKLAVAQVKIKIHLIDNLLIKLLIEINIVDAKNIHFNFFKDRFFVKSCKNFQKVMKTKARSNSNIKRIIKNKKIVTIALNQLIEVLVIYHDEFLDNRDFLFESQCSIDMKQNDNVYAHIVNSTLHII